MTKQAHLDIIKKNLGHLKGQLPEGNPKSGPVIALINLHGKIICYNLQEVKKKASAISAGGGNERHS